MTTLDGPAKLLSTLRSIADGEDKLNALIGVGLVLRTGIVMTGVPDVTIAMDGESSMGGPLIFDYNQGDLIIPEDILLVSGDTVVMAPISKRRWIVLFKTRKNGDINQARIGYNADRIGGEFSGLVVEAISAGQQSSGQQASVGLSGHVNFTGYIQQDHLTTPDPAPNGAMRMYPKADDQWYQINSAGEERLIGLSQADTDALYLPLTGGTLSGTLNFNGAGLRIRGDMSTAPNSSRLMFQNSIPNQASFLGVKPNGTGVGGAIIVYEIDDTSNSPYGIMWNDGTQVNIGTGASGSGNPKGLSIWSSGEKWKIPTTGHLLAGTDNLYDIGAAGANRPRDLYLGGTANIGGALNVSGQTSLGATDLYWHLRFSPDNQLDIGASGAWRPRDLFVGRNAVIGSTLTGGAVGTGASQVAAGNHTHNYDASYVNVGGDSMSGRLVLNLQTGGIGSSGSSEGQLEVQNNGSGAAKISFHRAGAYAAYFGLDTDNVWAVGGWSMGAVRYAVHHDGTNPISESASGSTLVRRTANGYVYCNYINTSADDQGGTSPYRVAGQNGDGFLRWYTKSAVGRPPAWPAEENYFTIGGASTPSGTWTNAGSVSPSSNPCGCTYSGNSIWVQKTGYWIIRYRASVGGGSWGWTGGLRILLNGGGWVERTGTVYGGMNLDVAEVCVVGAGTYFTFQGYSHGSGAYGTGSIGSGSVHLWFIPTDQYTY